MLCWQRRADGVPLIIALTLLYRFAPARPVLWRYAIATGVLAGVAIEVTKQIFTWYPTTFRVTN